MKIDLHYKKFKLQNNGIYYLNYISFRIFNYCIYLKSMKRCFKTLKKTTCYKMIWDDLISSGISSFAEGRNRDRSWQEGTIPSKSNLILPRQTILI